MIYRFECDACATFSEVDNAPFQPPPNPACGQCGAVMDRVYNSRIDTSSCRDHDHIPEAKRVVRSGSIRSGRDVNADAQERRFARHIDQRRKLLREAGHNPEFRQTHSVPADLYHGKIRETGDKNYWNDPKNLARHSSTRVS